MNQSRLRSPLLAVFGMLGLLSLGACASDDEESRPGQNVDPATSPAPTAGKPGPLVIVTEHKGLDSAIHHLHVVPDWPASGQLDNGLTHELGDPVVAHVENGAIYIYRKTGVIERWKVDQNLKARPEKVLSFEAYKVREHDAETIWVSPTVAFLVDERTGKTYRWNPTTMEIERDFDIRSDVLQREGLNGQFQLGVASADRLFTAANWRDWGTSTVRPGASIAVFDANNPAGGPTLMENANCAASVSVGTWRDSQGYIYAVGDGARGFDLIADVNKNDVPHQCIVRMREDANELDPSFFVDLQEVTRSPSIATVYPLGDDKVLASMFSPQVSLTSVADPKDPGWFWEPSANYEYAIIDMKAGTSTKVAGLPPASLPTQKALSVDGETYVQVFRKDLGPVVYRVAPDGTTTKVLESPSGIDVQYIGRL